MEKIKILPQTIFKYQCDSELLSDTLEMIKDEEWKSNDQIEYIGQTYNCLLNRQSKYQKLYEWIHECLDEVKQELDLRCDYIKILQSWANRSGYGQWMWKHQRPLFGASQIPHHWSVVVRRVGRYIGNISVGVGRLVV